MNIGKFVICAALVVAASSRVIIASTVASSTSQLLPEGFDAGASSDAGITTKGQKVLSSDGEALKEDIKVEYGEGHGETIDEALKEAMKDVLQKVVGVYVDSDFRMNNDQIIRDEIITHCNGFIDHYKKIEESDDPTGRGKVVAIKAWVKMRDFVNRMKKIAPSQTVQMDGRLIASDLSNKINAELLLKKELEHLNPALDLMEVKLLDNIRPIVRNTTDEAVTLRYVFQVQYSKSRYYREFIPRLSRVLDQIAESKPKNRNLSLNVQKVKLFPADKIDNIGGEGWTECPVSGYCLGPKNYWYGGCAADTPKPRLCVSAMTSVTKGGSANVREWRLSERLNDVYNECRQKYYDTCKDVSCTLKLADGNGKILSQSSCKLAEEWFLPKWSIAFDYVDNEIDFIPFIKRWGHDILEVTSTDSNFGGSGGARGDWLDRYVGCIDITLDREDVAKIRTAEVKLETNQKGEN